MRRYRTAHILILLGIAASVYAITPVIDSLGQRTDRSGLVDIWYSLSGLEGYCVDITLTPVTASGETLTCATFAEPSDTGRICTDGSEYHVIWNIAADEPDREFYTDRISIHILAARPGVRIGECSMEPKIECGHSHTIVLKPDSLVWIWGNNRFGQLGDGTTTDRHTPVQVHGADDVGYLTGIIDISGGYYHTVGLKSDSTVWTWGANGYGQLGDGTVAERHTPVQVHGEGGSEFLDDIVSVAGGEFHTLALKSDGTVWAWGWNHSGQLGDNTTTDSYTPLQVHGEGDVGYLTEVKAIAAGENHSLALNADGTVWAWGSNINGQLGDGRTYDRYTPVQVHGEDDLGVLTEILLIAAGQDHSMALKSDGSVWAWGFNMNGQLGDSTTISSYAPVHVHGESGIGYLSDVMELSAGGSHSIAMSNDGNVWVWGANRWGQLGSSSITDKCYPIRVHGEGDVGYLIFVLAVIGGASHTVALKPDGSVWAWGNNVLGRLGDGTTTPRYTPVQVLGEDGVGFIPFL